MDHQLDNLTAWIRQTAANSNGLLIPVSGGSDSALCFWLCNRALPGRVVGVYAGKELRSVDWFRSVGQVEFTDTPGRREEREEMRWARFLAMSLARSYWLVGSRNRTEDELGTYSLSSRVATFLPLINSWKSEVQRLCAAVGVPDEIIASSLRADPDCGRPPELAEISFDKVEIFLKNRAAGREPAGLTAEQVRYLDGIRNRNAFKKTLPHRGPPTTR